MTSLIANDQGGKRLPGNRVVVVSFSVAGRWLFVVPCVFCLLCLVCFVWFFFAIAARFIFGTR